MVRRNSAGGPRAEDPPEGWCLIRCFGEFLALFVPLVIGAYKQLSRDISGTFDITVSFFCELSFSLCLFVNSSGTCSSKQSDPDIVPPPCSATLATAPRIAANTQWRYIAVCTSTDCRMVSCADYAASDIEPSVCALSH